MGKIFANLDIETIPTGTLDDFKMKKSPPKNVKDPVKIAAWEKENKEKEFRNQAKSPVDAKIITVGLILEDEEDLKEEDVKKKNCKAFFGEDEKEILVNLEKDLKERIFEKFEEGDEVREVENELLWVGYNIRKFDLEAIWIKAIKYELYFLAKLIPRNRFDYSVFDLMEKIQGPRTMDFISFDHALKVLDIGQKTVGMDGSKVYDEYLAGNLEKTIVPYCIDDIISNRLMFKKIRQGI